ncbi:hypothetical protein IKQ19_17350 [Candidatus Saccharibacteria bacterium]|nr:hypothetical protein [Candidatus Saccharibacteria bacterium]
MAYNAARNISQNTIKRLYGLSGNVCANPKCRKPLVTEDNQIGEIAHICAASPEGARFDPNMTDDERRSIDNLILLCESCNKLVDSNESDYSVSILRAWKNNHEGFTSSDVYNTYQKNIFEKQKDGLLRKQELNVDGTVYSSKFVAYRNEQVIKEKKGQYCLTDCLLSLAKEYEWNDFPDIFIKGIGGIGKSTEVKHAYNAFLDVFSDKANYDDYNFFPIVYFFELKEYRADFFKQFDNKENIILFLDGLDEISDLNFIDFVKFLKNTKNQFPNVRFVISGRPAAFDSEIDGTCKNRLTIELSDDFDLDNPKNRKLLARFQNSAISDVIPIPFYRKFLEKNNEVIGYKDFYEKVILDLLEKDKRKADYANDISLRHSEDSTINKKKIIDDLSTLCYYASRLGKIVFSEQELKDATKENFCFVINSSLINYSNANHISFVSNLFFEYFLASFYLKNQSKIKKDLFLASGRLNVKYVNVVSIILNIANPEARVVSWLKKKLGKETNAFILLTDYRTQPPKTRYEYYKKIFEEFSKKGKNVYYLRWRSSFNCLSGVSALNKAMCELIPDEYRNEIFDYLLGYIAKYHNERNGANAVGFANAIILLGLWGDKLWGKSQQEKLKESSIDVLNTFLHDSLIKERTNGLLNEDIVLYWYKAYDWTLGWKECNWNVFLKWLFPNTQGFGSFVEDEEYHFQLELFNEFSDDKYIKQLAKPLCVEVMKRSSEDISIAGYIPEEIDDEFKTPVVHTDSEIYGFISILKENELLSADDVVDIIKSLINAHVLFHSTNYEFVELKKLIRKTLQSQANALSLVKCKDLYEIIACSMDDSKEFPLYEFESCLRALPDQIKYDLLNKIIQNLNDTKWERNWNFCNLISILLDVNNGVDENLEFVQQNIQKDTYNRLISRIYWNSDKSRSLYQYVKSIYEKDFAAEVEKQAEKEKLLSDIRKKNEEKLANEGSLLINPSAIIEEINAVEEFMKKHTTNGVPDYDFHDLDYETIENNIRHEINFKCKHTPIFSDFVVKLLNSIRWRGSYLQLFTDVKNLIKEWFSNEKTYWVCFYNCYVQTHSDEEVKKFLDENKGIKKKIIESMANDVVDLQKQLDERLVVSLSQKNWITPFVKYIHIILDGKIPEYIDRNKLLLIIAYPSKFLVSSSTFFKNPSAWGDSSSSFDWLHDIAGFKHSEIVGKALELYPLIDSLYIKAQILSGLVKHLNCQENEIIKIIIDETKHVFEKIDSPEVQDDLRFAVLPEFWQNADKKYLSMIYDFIPFEKYGLRLNNPCLSEVIAYALKYMTVEQKEQLIAKHESSLDPEIRELMRRLGSKKEILRKIREYLEGGKVDSHFGYNHAYLFGFLKKNFFILFAYWKLFRYSLAGESERRSYLFTIAKKGIKEHLDPITFKFLKLYTSKVIKKRRNAGQYVDGLYDFIDEMEQSVYSS